MTYKRFLIVFSATIIAFFTELAINIACGWEPDTYDYYVSYFHNNIAGEEYKPFMFTQYSYMYTEEESVDEATINSREWADYLGRVKVDDVLKVMYHTDSTTGEQIKLFLQNKKVPLADSLQQNTYLRALKKNKKARTYFLFAKTVEPLANIQYDPWDPAPLDTTAMLNKAEEALILSKKFRKDDFMKLRYAYQAARMFHYATAYEKCMEVYESEIMPMDTHSSAKGWATSLYAGALRRVDQNVKAAFLFSKVFESNPERRIQAYKNFHYIDVPIEEVFALADNKNEEATIVAIQSFGNPDLDFKSLSALYNLAPKSQLVAPMLIREVNKLEERLLEVDRIIPQDYFSSFTEREYRQEAMADAKKLRDFALEISKDPVVSSNKLGVLTAAYLSWMLKEDEIAKTYLAMLNTDILSGPMLDQYRITQILINLNAFNDHRNVDKDELISALNWLDEKRYEENGEMPPINQYGYYDYVPPRNTPFTFSARNIYQNILAPAYLREGDTAMAALAMVKGDLKYKQDEGDWLLNNMSYRTQQVWQDLLQPDAMKRLEEIKGGVVSDSIGGLFSGPLKRMSTDDFYELFGTTFLRTHQYVEAYDCFNKISAEYRFSVPQDYYDDNKKPFSDPFATTVNDYPKAYRQSKGIDKRQFAQKMHELQQETKEQGEKAARAYYLMANAVYQTGTFGNSWKMISYSWTSADNYYTDSLRYYDGDFKQARTAEQWYLKARNLSEDADFRAKCTFMLAKCAQKQFTFSDDLYSWDFRKEGSLFVKKSIYSNPYMKELASSYQQTAFYRTAVGECSYLRDFIGSLR